MSDSSGQEPPTGSRERASAGQEGPTSEEELKARLEEEMRRIKVGDVVLQTAVTLLNLGFRRLGLTEETKADRDLGQANQAIEALRSMLPAIEKTATEQVEPLRDALSQLQLRYAQLVGAGGEGTAEDRPSTGPEAQREPEQAKSSSGAGAPKSKLWTPPGV